MLKSLSIQNYALISSLKVEFEMGLTTITGETGAGKSILMGALSLILGARADTGVLLNKSTKCYVEGVFSAKSDELLRLLQENDLDQESEIILRREIVPSGKSRAFINDTPVNLSLLKEFGDLLVNIHAQHQNLMLNQENFAVLALDSFLKLTEVRRAFSAQFQAYRNKKADYLNLKSEFEQERRNQDFIEFQLNQLLEARLDELDQTELENEREVLEHAEEIQSKLGSICYSLEDDDRAMLPELKQIIQTIKSIENFYHELSDPVKRLDETYLELKDITSELVTRLDKVESNPERLMLIQEKLDLLYTLQQKHQVKSREELISVRDKFDEQLSNINTSSGQLVKLEKELETDYEELFHAANELSEKRQSGIEEFCVRIVEQLRELGLPNAKFAIDHERLDHPENDGVDAMTLLFAANKNQEPQEVSKVASGGEISRLMLCIKGLISTSLNLGTLIFDEIDSGVSGEIAFKMGKVIQSISKGRQVLNITHLPQVARSGDHHLLVYKYDDDNTTHTAVKKLDSEERVQQLARMLSGEKVSNEALSNARELLK
jgi:DNA repair protein RecN (Recombination protein N)